MAVLAILVGLLLLIKGGDWLLESAVALSLRLSIPKAVIGMTVVSFATSAPELIVSVQSALEGFSSIALGNVVGSNIANLALVLAITVIIQPIEISKVFLRIDWPMMMVASALFLLFLVYDAYLSFWEGAVMFTLLISFILYLLKNQKEGVDELDEEFEHLSWTKTIGYLLMGGFSLWLGAETLVKGAVDLAKMMGVNERIIGISIISIGTSIPELSASIIAILRKEKAISLGNLIGSNIFNILAVMGITAMVQPFAVMDADFLTNDLIWMIGISLLLLPLMYIPNDQKFNRLNGVILLSLYIYFIYSLF